MNSEDIGNIEGFVHVREVHPCGHLRFEVICTNGRNACRVKPGIYPHVFFAFIGDTLEIACPVCWHYTTTPAGPRWSPEPFPPQVQ